VVEFLGVSSFSSKCAFSYSTNFSIYFSSNYWIVWLDTAALDKVSGMYICYRVSLRTLVDDAPAFCCLAEPEDFVDEC